MHTNQCRSLVAIELSAHTGSVLNYFVPPSKRKESFLSFNSSLRNFSARLPSGRAPWHALMKLEESPQFAPNGSDKLKISLVEVNDLKECSPGFEHLCHDYRLQQLSTRISTITKNLFAAESQLA